MADFATIKTSIDANIKANGKQQITGEVLNSVLKQMVDSVDEQLSEISEENEIQIEDLRNTKIDKEADDYYPQLSVGTADNLAGVDEVDSEFSLRRSGGGAIADGVARIQALKGNSIIWNQQSSGITLEGDTAVSLPMGARVVKGHKYILLCDAQENNPSLYLYGYLPGKNPEIIASLRGVISTFFVSPISLEATSVANTEGGLWWYQAGNATSKTIAPRLINLTQMFGQGNEPTTIEDFYQRIPVGVNLYAYNSGVAINFFADGIKSVGRNLYDGEKARLIGGKTYFLNGIYKSLSFNGESLTLPGNRLFTPSISGEIEVEGEGICINLSDSEFNGAYEKYMESIQDLTMLRKYFTNGMRGRGEACDKMRYNKSSHRWEIVRLGEIDMGTLNWFDDNFNGVPTFTSKDVTNGVLHDYEVIGGTLLEPYIEKPRFDDLSKSDDRVFIFNSSAHAPNTLAVRDTRYSNAAAFKAAMSGVMLYYELSEPIVTPINEEFNLDYKVENGGTEEIISTSPSSAMRADIAYGFNAVGLIKQLRSMIEALSAKVANL